MKVIKNVPQTPPPATYDILGLTEYEARVLHALCYFHIAGAPSGPRGVFDRIGVALAAADVPAFRDMIQSVKATENNCLILES